MSLCARPTKRPVNFQGLLVHVEIEAGERKAGVDEDGLEWSKTYGLPYGEIVGTYGADRDPVDCYLGPNPHSDQVWVIHQQHRNGAYDEDKVMLGFNDAAAAETAYRAHGPAWGFRAMEAMSVEEFRAQLALPPAQAQTMAERAERGQTRFGA